MSHNMLQKLNINNFILDNFAAAKPLTIKIKFVPLDVDVVEENHAKHAQAKCTTVKWPFAAMQNVKECRFLKAHVLAEGNEQLGTKHLMEIIFDAKAFADFDIAPGDTVGILPQNSAENVQRVLKALNLEAAADKYYRMELASPTEKKSALPAHVPSIATPREILRDCLNLQDVPKKQFLSALASFCKDEKERAFLSCLSSKEGLAYYDEIILQQKYNLLDLLEFCPTCQPPLELLVQSMQRLLPRPYSVANSLNERPHEIDIIFSVKPNDPGVTSGMLEKLIREQRASSSCYMFLRAPTDFRYTKNQLADNQVFICIGTALAPFLGFLEEKAFHSRTLKDVGQTWLFLGAKTKNHVIQRERLEEWQENGILNEYFVALSRDSQHSKYKYLQECMLQHKQKLNEFWLQANTTIYVCADGGVISKDIMKTITAILSDDENAAKQLLINWKTNGKLIEHNWW